MKILIAEDDGVSRRVLETRLEKWGHQVVITKDGAEAWNVFKDEEFSMVITDWMMPELDGVELLKRIRSSHTSGYVYIMMLTAKQQKNDLLEAMEAGADDFLTKPFDKDELRVRLRAGERIIELEKNLARRNRELKTVNERMKQDLEAASSIQRSLLPAKTPDIPGFNFAWKFKPCDELAGDSLNIFALEDQHVGLYVLDVSGHGVSAALLSVTLSRLLSPTSDQSTLVKQQLKDSAGFSLVSPAQVAEQLNRQFKLDTRTGQFFTILYSILNIKTGELRYVSAGHPSIALLSRNTDPSLLENPGFPIGFIETAEYDENLIRLKPGDRLYMYSDGITEAKNTRKELFSEKRLIEVLHKNFFLPLDESLSALLMSLEKWNGTGEYEDDITILAIEMEG